MTTFPLMLAAARLVFSGVIGQTSPDGAMPPVPWTECGWCVADASGDVHFPGGWRVGKGTRRLEKERNDVPGFVFTDGEGALFYFHPQRAELGLVEVSACGLGKGRALARLHHWDLTLHAAPGSCPRGYAARGRFFALDRRQREVRAWAADGTSAGTVFACGARTNKFVSLAIHPPSGDLLLGTDWPESKVHRFRPDGTEVEDAFWPYPGLAWTLANSGGETWMLGPEAQQIVENRAPKAQRRFGQFANRVRGIAWGGSGFFLATTQGGQYYPANDSRRCAWRIGGVGNVTALAVHDGRILACDGYRMFNFWLDDEPSDPISSDTNWNVAKAWDERVTAIEVRDGVFRLREEKHGRTVVFDPRVTEWVFRAKRLYDDPGGKVVADGRRAHLAGGYEAVAEEAGIVLRRLGPDGKAAESYRVPAHATYIAGEGEWLVAYEPARKALVRYRLVLDADARHYGEEEAKLRRAFAAAYMGEDGQLKVEYRGQCNDLNGRLFEDIDP